MRTLVATTTGLSNDQNFGDFNFGGVRISCKVGSGELDNFSCCLLSSGLSSLLMLSLLMLALLEVDEKVLEGGMDTL